MTNPDDRDRDAVEQETEHTIRGTVDGNVVTVNVLGPESQVLDDDDDRVGSGIVAERIREKIGDLDDELEDEKLIADGGTPATGDQHFNHIETDDIPEFVERGEREEDLKFGGGWDYYECPACGELICSFCDCPNEECRWYDADDWKKAIRETARERDDIYTGTLEVKASA